MGNFTTQGKITTDAYNAARKCVGHFPGGLAVTTTVASAIFGAVCGSGSSTAIVMTQMAWPEMKKYKYQAGIGLGSVCAAGPLAILIPPSTPLIMYGIYSDTSISDLFKAGWIPGVLLCIALCLGSIIWVKIHPEIAPRAEKTTWKEKIKAISGIWSVLLLVIVVMGSIWGGLCTVSEGASVGVIGALIIAICRRTITKKSFFNAIKSSALMGGSMFFMFVGVGIFNKMMVLSGITTAIARWVAALPIPKLGIIWVIILIYLVLGCFLETPLIMTLTVPLFAPIISELGYNLIWFGIIIALVSGIGAITPPVGINLFVVNATAPDAGFMNIVKGCFPYIGIMLVFLAIVVFFPQIILCIF